VANRLEHEKLRFKNYNFQLVKFSNFNSYKHSIFPDLAIFYVHFLLWFFIVFFHSEICPSSISLNSRTNLKLHFSSTLIEGKLSVNVCEIMVSTSFSLNVNFVRRLTISFAYPLFLNNSVEHIPFQLFYPLIQKTQYESIFFCTEIIIN